MMPEVTACRVCAGDNLKEIIGLGSQPLANSLLINPDDNFVVYPLKMMLCQDCLHGQLSTAVDPAIIFGPTYPFRSGVSEAWQSHCQKLVDQTSGVGTVVEIGSNDGTLLGMYAKKGMTAIGVDPSGVEVDDVFLIKDILTDEGVEKIEEISGGNVRLVVMQNVLAHVHDLHTLMSKVVKVMDDGTTLIIEVPPLELLLRNCLFDTIYHEHYSYFSTHSLTFLLQSWGLVPTKVCVVPTHGGSLRMFANKCPSTDKVFEENPLNWMPHVDEFNKKLADLKAQAPNLPWSMVGLGASAKATVALNVLDISQHFTAIVDEAETKTWKYIPIVGDRMSKVIYPPTGINWPGVKNVFIFSWNNYDALREKLKKWGHQGAVFSIKDGRFDWRG